MQHDQNRVELKGRLTADPELRRTGSGKAVTHARLATNRYKKDDQGNSVRVPTFHRLTLWERDAEVFAERGRAGSRVILSGSIEYGEFTNKDGVVIPTCEIFVRSFDIIPKQNASAADEEATPEADGTDGTGEVF